mmetsp:Transcript_9768/g.14285  ORF Transcript_9768/g.14285 Transcript_9768/m.14285 type:complete len:264 (+) Transcript_9768:26-817(+)
MLVSRSLLIAIASSLLSYSVIDIVDSFASIPSFSSRSSSINSALSYSNSYLSPSPVRVTDTRARIVTSIESPEHLRNVLAEDDRLVVVKIYANWCKTCKVFDVRYRKLARKESLEPDQRVRFAEIEFTANEELSRSLGGTRLPFIILYKNASNIDDITTAFQCGPAYFQNVIDAVNEHAGVEDECQTPECLFEKKMEVVSSLGDEIANQLQIEAKDTYSSDTSFEYSSDTSFEEFCYAQSAKTIASAIGRGSTLEEFCHSHTA